MKNCIKCNNELFGKYKIKFCSRSCSTSYRNLTAHARKGKGKGKPICASKNCNKRTVSYNHKFCRECIDNKRQYNYTQNPTKQELVELYIQKYPIS